LKPITLIAAILLIFAATFAFEYYANSQFETAELEVTGLPELGTGIEHSYSYIKTEEVVGSYTYSVEEAAGGYLMTSETEVSNEADTIELTTEFTFSDGLKPEKYDLVVYNNEDRTDIVTEVSGSEIITYVTYEGVTVNITDEYVDYMLLIEPNMPGFWEILFNSVNLEGGVKYDASIYVPQAGAVVPIELVVSRNPQNVRVGDEQLSCTVIKEAGLDLAFFVYEDELVQMRSDGLSLLFIKDR
jgi:hypothetical protein